MRGLEKRERGRENQVVGFRFAVKPVTSKRDSCQMRVTRKQNVFSIQRFYTQAHP